MDEWIDELRIGLPNIGSQPCSGAHRFAIGAALLNKPLTCSFACFRLIGDVVFYRHVRREGDGGWGR